VFQRQADEVSRQVKILKLGDHRAFDLLSSTSCANQSKMATLFNEINQIALGGLLGGAVFGN
jgi:hypothetical protein